MVNNFCLSCSINRKSPSYGNVFRGSVKDKFHKRCVHNYIPLFLLNLLNVVKFYCPHNRYGFVFEDSDPTFNAGVYGVNFDLWRSRNMHREVQYWLDEVSSHRKFLWFFSMSLWFLLFHILCSKPGNPYGSLVPSQSCYLWRTVSGRSLDGNGMFKVRIVDKISDKIKHSSRRALPHRRPGLEETSGRGYVEFCKIAALEWKRWVVLRFWIKCRNIVWLASSPGSACMHEWMPWGRSVVWGLACRWEMMAMAVKDDDNCWISGKPWLEEGLHRDLWLPHLPRECSRRGRCTTLTADSQNYFCLCREGYAGRNCQKKWHDKRSVD